MDIVVEKTQALGKAIRASQEFINMQIMEAVANEDPVAKELNLEIKKKQAEMYMGLQTGAAQDEIDKASREAEELRDQLANLPSTKQRDEARVQFSRLMERVNDVLQFTIMGEITDNSSGCGAGSCEGCSGCD